MTTHDSRYIGPDGTGFSFHRSCLGSVAIDRTDPPLSDLLAFAAYCQSQLAPAPRSLTPVSPFGLDTEAEAFPLVSKERRMAALVKVLGIQLTL